MDAINKLASDLRSAVLAGDHARAALVAEEYVETIAKASHALEPEEQTRAQALLNWAREVTIAQRALTAEHLAVVQKASRYEPALAAEPESCVLQVRI